MRYLIAAVVLFSISCSSPKKLTLDKIHSKQSVQETQTIISTLADDSMGGRKPGTPEMENATRYVERFLEQNNIRPFFNGSYRDSMMLGEIMAYNVVGIIGDKKKSSEYILIGAHLDHLGKVKSVRDSVYNGANDNASGVTAAMQTAKFLSQYKFSKNIIIALFTAEEMGLLGSDHLAKRLKEKNINLKYVINFEMLGMPMVSGSDKVYITGFTKSNFSEKVNGLLGAPFIEFLPEEDVYGLFMRSDNYPFYENYNIPAHTISTFDFKNYRYYHNLKDEVAELDIPHMNGIINRCTLAVIKLLTQQSVIELSPDSN